MRSFAATALCVALIHSTDARVPHSFRDLIQRDAQPTPQPQEGIFDWFSRLLKRSLKPRQDDATCYEDDYYVFVGSPSLGEGFCQDYMDYPNRTVPVQATATSTFTTTYTTNVDTITEYTRETPASTTTQTITAGGAKVKREGNAQITARAVLNRKEAFQLYRRQTNNTDDDSAMASAFSSACSCHNYDGPVVSETYTGQTTVRTVKAFGNVDTTTTVTQTAAASVATTTTTVALPSTTSSSAAAPPPSGTTSEPAVQPAPASSNPSNPTPTAPAFTCPGDNNKTISQMVGSERFDYLVLCDTVLMDADIYSGVLSYRSFSECVGACSVADQQFDNPVCQGVSFQATDASGAGNCFLKGSANHTVMADGVDSALLRSIVVGVSNGTVQGTATESLPFAGVHSTASPEQVNSMIGSMVANSTASMPMVTPFNSPVASGRQVNQITGYSTYVSDGSTFSTGTGYTTRVTLADGSWYEAYYTSWSKSWDSVATVYGYGEEGGVEVQNSTASNSYGTSGANGQYGTVTWYNTTYANGSMQDVVQTVSYEADGTPFYSTATTYFIAATGSAGGAGGGGASVSLPASTPAGPLVTSSVVSSGGNANGGNAGGASGAPASGGPSVVTSISTFSTQSVISLPGGTGYEASGYASGGPPVTQTYVSTIVTNGSTAYSTYYVVSGGPTGTGGAASSINSGAPSNTPSPTLVTVISTAYATGGELRSGASGRPGSTAGASSGIISGGPSSSPSPSLPSEVGSLSIVTVVSSPGGTGYEASAIISGRPTGTGGASSGIIPGGPSSPLTASFTGDLRSGTLETSPTANGTAPLGTSPLTASFTGDLRSGTLDSSTSAPLLTAPSGGIYSPAGVPSGTAPGIATNGTAPAGTSPLTASFTGDLRSGTLDTSSSGAPLFTAPSNGVYTPPLLTAPSGSLPVPTGVAPSGTSPGSYTGSDASRYGTMLTGTAPSGTAPPGTAPPGTAPTGTAPPGTSPGTYTAPEGSRYGDYSSSAPLSTGFPVPTSPGTGTAPHPYPSMTFPAAQSSCVNGTMGTTTLFSTTTVYGCYSTCLPQWGGYGGPGPHPFGPPSWPTEMPEAEETRW